MLINTADFFFLTVHSVRHPGDDDSGNLRLVGRNFTFLINFKVFYTNTSVSLSLSRIISTTYQAEDISRSCKILFIKL